MFPRLTKITRLVLVAFFVFTFLMTVVFNVGRSPGASQTSYVDMSDLNYGRSVDQHVAKENLHRENLQRENLQRENLQRENLQRENSHDSNTGTSQMKNLHRISSLSQTPSGAWTKSLEDAGSFVSYINYRLNTAGIRAIREMKSSEKQGKVNLPAKPVNPHNFRYIHNPSHVCSKHSSSLNFLIYIHSAPGNLKRRQIIRQTWGNPQLLTLLNASMIFALGAPHKSPMQKMLDMEYEEYADLLQEDYTDAYRNLTYKGMSVLKWANDHCSHPLFFIKTDDDILLDIVSLVDHLLTKTVPSRGAKRLVLCNVWTTMKVIRDPKSKWGLSKEEFPLDVFPPYCSGSAFILSGDMVPGMYDAALRSKFFWVDDYFVSGMLVNAMGVKHERFNQAYLLNGIQIEEKLVNDTRKLMVVHIKSYPIFFRAWGLLMKRHPGMDTFLHKHSTLNTIDIRIRFANPAKNTSSSSSSSQSSKVLPLRMTSLPQPSSSSSLPSPAVPSKKSDVLSFKSKDVKMHKENSTKRVSLVNLQSIRPSHHHLEGG